MADTSSESDAYTRDYDEKIALSTELHKLSSQEFDKQVVYIAGGGLALTLTFAKDIASVTNSHFIPLLLVTWLLFATALLVNLFSYRKAAQNYDASTSLHRHYRECHVAGKPINEPKCNDWKNRMNTGDTQVTSLNSWSFGTVAAGIASFILFVLLNVLNMSDQPPTPKPSTEKPAVAAPYEGTRGISAPAHLLTTPAPPTPQPTVSPAPASDSPSTSKASE